MIWEKLTPRERFTRCIIQLSKERPYFSHILYYFKFVEAKDLPLVTPIGVNEDGIVVYNPKFIKKVREEELKNILCHEVLHITFKHLERRGRRNPIIWNIVADLKVNETLAKENIYIETGIYEIEGILDRETIEKSTTEALYDKLMKAKKEGNFIPSISNGRSEYETLDKHIYPEDEGKEIESRGKEIARIREQQRKIDWDKVIREAYVRGKQHGKIPAGLERYLDGLLQTRLPWRTLLQKYIVREIPVDYTWERPHKRSFNLGYYLPSVKKERVDVVIAIDTSGSISDLEYRVFMSEVIGILSSFPIIRGTMIQCDADIQQVTEINETTKYELLNGPIKRKGYGGTDFRPVFKWIRENRPNTKILIYLTDLFGTFPKKDKVNHRTIWVTKTRNHGIPFGEKIYFDIGE